MAIARSAYAAFSRGGTEAILEYVHPDIEWHMWEYFSGSSRVLHGYDGVRQVMSIFMRNIENFSVEPLEFIDAGDRVVVPVRLRGLSKETHEEVEFDLVQVWQERDRKAIRLDAYGSKEEALKAVSENS